MADIGCRSSKISLQLTRGVSGLKENPPGAAPSHSKGLGVRLTRGDGRGASPEPPLAEHLFAAAALRDAQALRRWDGTGRDGSQIHGSSRWSDAIDSGPPVASTR